VTGFTRLLPMCAVCVLAQAQQGPSRWADGQGAHVPVPQGWSANQRLLDHGGPLSLTSFGGVYAPGGILPPLGAEIEIASFPRPRDLMETIRKELRGPQLNMQEASLGAQSGVRVSYRDSISPEIELTTVVYYIPHGERLYKFFLSYRTGHPEGAALETSLEDVVRRAVLR